MLRDEPYYVYEISLMVLDKKEKAQFISTDSEVKKLSRLLGVLVRPPSVAIEIKAVDYFPKRAQEQA